ncbi:MAG: hypothetical protein Q9170_003021 [Blastenia crenularia]
MSNFGTPSLSGQKASFQGKPNLIPALDDVLEALLIEIPTKCKAKDAENLSLQEELQSLKAYLKTQAKRVERYEAELESHRIVVSDLQKDKRALQIELEERRHVPNDALKKLENAKATIRSCKDELAQARAENKTYRSELESYHAAVSVAMDQLRDGNRLQSDCVRSVVEQCTSTLPALPASHQRDDLLLGNRGGASSSPENSNSARPGADSSNVPDLGLPQVRLSYHGSSLQPASSTKQGREAFGVSDPGVGQLDRGDHGSRCKPVSGTSWRSTNFDGSKGPYANTKPFHPSLLHERRLRHGRFGRIDQPSNEQTSALPSKATGVSGIGTENFDPLYDATPPPKPQGNSKPSSEAAEGNTVSQPHTLYFRPRSTGKENSRGVNGFRVGMPPPTKRRKVESSVNNPAIRVPSKSVAQPSVKILVPPPPPPQLPADKRTQLYQHHPASYNRRGQLAHLAETSSTNGSKDGGEPWHDVEVVRHPRFTYDDLPTVLFDTLRHQMTEGWDVLRSDWEQGTRKGEPKCARRFAHRQGSDMEHGHACKDCMEQLLVCVAVRKGRIQLRPLPAEERGKAVRTQMAYWVRDE